MSYYCLDFLREQYDALLIGHGTPLPRPLLRRLASRSRWIIALDGGANHLLRAGIRPHHVIGDFDSASPDALAWAKRREAKIHFRPAADEPDFAKGLRLCRRLGYRRVIAVGFAGGRVDHLLAALHFSSRIPGLELTLITSEIAAFPLRGRVVRDWPVPMGHTVSWFGLPRAGGCTLSGVRWPFVRRTLRADGFHSLSNEPVEPVVTLRQERGCSLFVISLCRAARGQDAG